MTWLINVLVALLFFVLQAGTQTGVNPPGEESWIPVDVDGREGVIVSEPEALAFGVDADDTWLPTEANIEDVEVAIREQEGELPHMRQYLGLVIDGDRKIYINGFCDDMGRDWREEYVAVDDGGECYFGAMYNVNEGTLEYFRFNGPG